jgi:hypothetical protein
MFFSTVLPWIPLLRWSFLFSLLITVLAALGFAHSCRWRWYYSLANQLSVPISGENI